MIRLLGLLLALVVGSAQAATLLPNGKQQFFGLNGVPLVSGSVATYIPGTTTPKTTWQDSASSVPNTNPTILDSLGSAIMYGAGCYRQVVKDVNSVLVWDQLSCDSSVAAGILWGGISTGTANAQVVNTPAWSTADGQKIVFMAGTGLTNTGAVTIDAGTGPISLVKDTSSGNAALVAGDLVAGNVYTIVYSAHTSTFHTTLVAAAPASQLPVGTMLDWAGISSSLPTGFLIADGTCYNQVTYANLYAVIGTNFLNSSGTTCPGGEFAVPDTRGRYVAGVDSTSAGTAGRLTGSNGFSCTNTPASCSIAGTGSWLLNAAQLPVIMLGLTGSVTVDFHSTATYQESVYVAANAGTGAGTTYTTGTAPAGVTGVGPTSFPISISGGNTFGGGSTIYQIPPTLMATKIIKY